MPSCQSKSSHNSVQMGLEARGRGSPWESDGESGRQWEGEGPLPTCSKVKIEKQQDIMLLN